MKKPEEFAQLLISTQPLTFNTAKERQKFIDWAQNQSFSVLAIITGEHPRGGEESFYTYFSLLDDSEDE